MLFDLANIKHLLKNRLFILLGFTFIILAIHCYFTGSLIPSADAQNTWFYSGIFMVLFSILYIEPYFTSPKNIFMNVLPLILVLLPLKDSFHSPFYWWLFIGGLSILLGLSITSFAFYDGDKSPEDPNNRRAVLIKDLLMRIGKGKILYSLIFLYFFVVYYGSNHTYLVFMLTVWLLIVLFVDPKDTHFDLSFKRLKRTPNEAGTIIGVESGNIFTARLYRDKTNVARFDAVRFRHSIHNSGDEINYGVVIDLYELNAEKLARVLLLQTVRTEARELELDRVHTLNPDDPMLPGLRIADLAGTVAEGSSAGTLYFHTASHKGSLQEGDLLEIPFGRRTVYYQVFDAITEAIKIAAMDTHGRIRVAAIQLGEWDPELSAFTRFGWVPELNWPVYISTGAGVEVKSASYPTLPIGCIPNSTLPVLVNLADLVSHHTAIIGVTGSGKSYLTRSLLKHLATDTKIIFVDYNNEFKRSVLPQPEDLFDDALMTKLINLHTEKVDSADAKEEFNSLLFNQIEGFFSGGETSLRIFQPPFLDSVKEETQFQIKVIEAIFSVSRSYYNNGKPQRICIVIEEAHAIIPESGKPELISSVKKIALQGRKYGLGLLIVTQRTTNVSKDILSQCNTVICLQSFDASTKDILAGYAGNDVKGMVSGLKRYQAVVVGKALKSAMPIIVDTYGVGE